MRPTTRRAALPFLLLAAACGSDAATRERPATADTTPAVSAPPAPDAGAPRTRVTGTSTSLQVTPNSVPAGGQIVVRFSIRNDGTEAARMTLSCDAAAVFRLRHADAPPGSEALVTSNCPPVVRTHVVPPGAELVLQLPSRAQAGNPPAPLAPGRYVIEATPNVTEIDGRPLTLRPVSAELQVR